MSDKSFNAGHHAILFGLIAKEVIFLYKEKGKYILAKAIKKYGNQRGNRMAMRAKQDGEDLSIVNYLIYSEWDSSSGGIKSEIKKTEPDFEINITDCIWYKEWLKNDMLEYANIYCKYIDKALVEGFNSKIDFNIYRTRSEGNLHCAFSFENYKLNKLDLAVIKKRKTKLGKKAIMPWEYHTGHLYKILKTILINELNDCGEKIINNSLNKFSKIFGENSVHVIKNYENTNFEKLPIYTGIKKI